MRPWLLLSLLGLTGCIHRPEPADPVDQAVKARYWAIQEAQRVRTESPARRLPLRKPERIEQGARRVPSTEEIILPHSP